MREDRPQEQLRRNGACASRRAHFALPSLEDLGRIGRIGRIGHWLIVTLILALLPGVAHSERKRAQNEEEAAAELLQRGKAALAAGDLAGAQTAITNAYRSDPSPLGLYLLARLALAEKREIDAYDLMRRFLADPELDASDSTAAAKTGAAAPTQSSPPVGLQAEIHEAEQIVAKPPQNFGSLSIRGERGALVFIDGRLVGALPLPLPLAVVPTEHKVALSRGSVRIEDQVHIPAGRSGELRSDINSRALVLSILPGVLVLEELQDVPELVRQRLRQSIEKALLERRMSPLTRDFALSLAQAPQLAGCLLESKCQVELARKVEAESILVLRVRPSPSGLQMRVGYLDLTVGEEASADEHSCSVCSPEQLGGSLVDLVSRVYESGHGRPRATLIIQADPIGSEVLLDNKPAGSTPFHRMVFSGRHQLTVRKEGYVAESRDVILRDNEQRSVDLVLTQPEPAPAPLVPVYETRRMPRPTWRIALGSVLIAGGALAMGFGVGARIVDGQCVQPAATQGAECKNTFNTQGLSATLFGGGFLAVAGGVVLIALPGPKRQVLVPP